MSKRFWLLGLIGLISAGLLLACGSSYNSSSQGLVLVGSQGSSIIQTFSFDLNTGHSGAIANSTNDTISETCVLNGSPSDMVMNPSAPYAYVIFNSSSQCPNATQVGIAVFQVKSDGTVAQVGSLITLNAGGGAPVSPGTLSVDAAGKFLFVANRKTVNTTNQPVPGTISVLATGRGGSLTEVPGSPFFTPLTTNLADIVSVAATSTVFPGVGINGQQNAGCAVGITPPTSEYLYAADANNYVLWQFSVDTTSGVLGNPPGTTMPSAFSTDAVPAGVAVDPCDRFVYASSSLHNKINAYTICMAVTASGPCPLANGALVDVSGSPFAVTGSANGLGPILVDRYGKFVYAVGTLSNTVSGFKIADVSGALTTLNPATAATGSQPKSITIRADDNWMFVSNYGSASVSQYSITPATGALTVSQPLQTDNYPWGVAVK